MSRWTNALYGIENLVYLELGTYDGTTITRVNARERYGVDCTPRTMAGVTHQMTTDEFFSQWGTLNLPAPDVVYIDADHSFEQVVKDYRNVCKILAPNGLVFAHDLIPPDYAHAAPGYCDDAWRFLYWALLDDLAWAPGCFSNRGDFGATCFPQPLMCPDVPPDVVQTAPVDFLWHALQPEQNLTDEEYRDRVYGLRGARITTCEVAPLQ